MIKHTTNGTHLDCHGPDAGDDCRLCGRALTSTDIQAGDGHCSRCAELLGLTPAPVEL